MVRVRSVMTGVGGSPFYSNLFFNEAASPDPDALVALVAGFWGNLAGWSALALDGVVEGQVPTIDPATGDIMSVATVADGEFTGNRSGATLPPATQGLLRLLTGSYEGGRQVRGRIFIPALSVEAGTSVPGAGPTGQWGTSAVTFMGDVLDAGYEWVVWSRKNGVQRTIIGATPWSQYAVLRSRRD